MKGSRVFYHVLRCAGGNFMIDDPREGTLPAAGTTGGETPGPQPVAAAPASSTSVAVFIGRDGLRSGWGFVLYLLMFGACITGLSLLPRLMHLHLSGIWGFSMGEALSLVAALVPALVMAYIEKRPFGVYGLPASKAFGKLFWVGALWGIVSLSAMMAAMRGTGVFYFGAFAIHGRRLAEYAVFWAVFFVIVGLFEEFLLRGYTQFTLTRGIGFWPSALLLSVAFGAIHLGNKGEDRVGALGAAIIGLFFCLTIRRTGNLWFAVGLHASWDWGETFLYSVPNSGMVAPGHLLNSSFQGPRWLTGGSVGPEASIFVFILMALMWVVFHFTYPAKREAAGVAPPGIPGSTPPQVSYQE
jgi:membrane protease YdiL (CAAX protease family)